MIKNTNDQNNGQVDFDRGLDDEADRNGSRPLEGGVDMEDRFGEDRDPNALPVTLNASTVNGEDCVELHAHGETISSETGKMAKRAVLLARVSARELTMYPLDANAHQASFLEPKYDELRSITIVAQEHKPWRLPKSERDFDEMLNELPTGFARHAKYGLGFKWEYRLIPEAILEMDGVTELVIGSCQAICRQKRSAQRGFLGIGAGSGVSGLR